MNPALRLKVVLILALTAAACSPDGTPAPGGDRPAAPEVTQAPDSGDEALAPAAAVATGGAAAGTPDVDDVLDRVFGELLSRDPEYATDLGLADRYGIPGDQLTDVSADYRRETDRLVDAALAELQGLDRSNMTPEQRVAVDALAWDLADRQRGQRFEHHDYPVNQVFGVQSSLPEFMAFIHPLEDEADARAFIARLGAWDTRFAQVTDQLQDSAELGIVPPRFILQRVLGGMRDFAATPAEDSVIAFGFRTRLEDVPSLSDAEKAGLNAEVVAAVDDVVYPAYREMIAYLETLEADATDDAGAWKLPDGDAYYAHALRHHTTTELTAAAVHALGLDEVARIQAEMRALLAEAGHGDDLAAGAGAIYGSAEVIDIRGASDRDAAIAAYRAALERAEQATGDLFALRPDARLEILRVPPYKELSGPGAYYSPPPVEGDRPGVFLVNLPDGRQVSMVDVPTLAVHEGVPGHHYQLSVQRALEDAPMSARAAHFTGYAEGWALYAERLVAERGMYDGDVQGDWGRLQAELFRAARLVVDTGIHDRGWTREEAIEYMASTLGWPERSAVGEVERYIVMPGQATAYKVGQLTILRLREEARAALGDDFDLEAFHTVVLENGQVPLAVLESVVEDWVAERQGGGSS